MLKKMQDTKAKQSEEKRQRAHDAQKRTQAERESMPDAFERIRGMKLTEKDLYKVNKVEEYLEAGEVARRPEDMRNKRGALKQLSKTEVLKLYDLEVAELERQKELQRMKDEVPDNYHLVQDWITFGAMLDKLSENEYIVFDVETTGVDTRNDEIVGFVMSDYNNNEHYYIPTNHETDSPQLPRQQVTDKLRFLFEDIAYKKIAHNGKFDIHMVKNLGVAFRHLYFDTQTACHVLNENEQSKRLKDLATKYLGMPSKLYTELFGKVGFHKVSDLGIALAYAAKDGELTCKLFDFQMHHLERVGLGEYYLQIEAPISEIIVKMERAGFVMDMENARKIGEQLKIEIEQINDKMRKAFGVDDEFNFNSSKQLAELLFDDLQLHKHLPKNKQKSRSTNKNVLHMLKSHHEGVAYLLEYRDKTKFYGTYIEKLPTRIHTDGFLYGEFGNDNTVTGRLMSENPNLQNQPKNARKMFRAPSGKIMLSGDFSQQEPRLLAHFTQEPTLVEAYRNGEDLYAKSASEIFDMPIEECGDGSKVRKMLKMGILAVMYGTGSTTLGEQLGISRLEAQKFIDDFYGKYPNVKQWQDDLLKYARKHGHVKMLYGRKRRVKDITDPEHWKRTRAERQIKNSVIQGSAAIQTKKTMIDLDRWCESKGDDYAIALQVHDEIGCYVPEDIPPEHIAEFEQIMLHAVELDVPAKVDIEGQYIWGQGVNWSSDRRQWIASDGTEHDTPAQALQHESKGA